MANSSKDNEVISYLRRVAEPVPFLFTKVIKNQMPITSQMIDKNTDTAKSLYNSIVKEKVIQKKISSDLDRFVFKPVNKLIENVKNDLKTGQFYHPEREDDMDMDSIMGMLGDLGIDGDMMSMLNGEDNEFDRPDEDENDQNSPQREGVRGIPTITKGDQVVASTIARTSIGSTNALGRVITKGQETSLKSAQSIATAQLHQYERQNAILSNGMSALAQGINSIIEFNNQATLQYFENSTKYFDVMTQKIEEQNAILKEMLDMKRNLYSKSMEQNNNEDNSQYLTAQKLFSGGFDLQSYLDYVQNNFQESEWGSMYQMLPMIMAGFNDFVNNPMQNLMEKGLESLLGPRLRNALNNFDDTLTGGIQTALAQLYDYGRKEGTGITGALAKLIGYKAGTTELKSIDTSKYERGAMSWNGIAQKTLVEVIPSSLSRIEAAVTGQTERIFDYETGKWKSIKDVINYEKNIKNTVSRNVTKDIEKQVKAASYSLNLSREDQRQFNKDIRNVMQGIFEKGYVKFDDIRNNVGNKYGKDNKNLALIADILENGVDRKEISRLTGKINAGKESIYKNALDTDPNNPTLATRYINGMTNGAIIADGSNLKIKTKSSINGKYGLPTIESITSKPPSAILENKDKYGNGLLDYQFKILKELFYIRRNQENGFGISSSTNPIIPNNPNNNQNNNSSDSVVSDFEQYISNNRDTVSNEQEISEETRNRIEERRNIRNNRINNRLSTIRYSYNFNDIGDRVDLDRYREDDEYREDINNRFAEILRDSQNLSKEEAIKNAENYLEQAIRVGRDLISDEEEMISGVEEKTTGFMRLLSAPRDVLASIVEKADQTIYDFLFDTSTQTIDENGKPIKGLFNKMVYDMENTIDRLNKWIDEIFDSATSWFKNLEIGKTIKDTIKDWFDVDLDKLWETGKDKIKSIFGYGKNAIRDSLKNSATTVIDSVSGTLSDLGININRNNTQTEEAETQDTQNTPTLSFGTKQVTKGGLAFISPGEAIIPADLNPWNPDRDKVNRHSQSLKEEAMKQQFISGLDHTLGKYIKTRADGDTGAATTDPGFKEPNKKRKRNANKAKKLTRQIDEFNALLEDPNAIMEAVSENSPRIFSEKEVDKIINSNGFKKLPYSKRQVVLKSLSQMGHNVKYDRSDIESQKYTELANQGKDNVLVDINEFANRAFGVNVQQAAKLSTDFVKDNYKEIAGGGTVGTLLSTIFPLGGPLMGAITGAAASLILNNKTAQEWLFGKEVVDQEGNSHRSGGLFSEKLVKTMERYLPDLKKYGITGSLVGLVTPFGPLGGLMLGAGASFIKNNQEAHDFFFGESEGLINEDRKKAIKKAFPNVAAGTLAMMLGGPFGIVGNAMLGSGLGIISSTEIFKKILLGTKGIDGRRYGGLAGAIQMQITDPFKKSMEQMSKDISKWFKDDIFRPIGRGILPITKLLAYTVRDNVNNLGRYLTFKLGRAGTFFDRLFNYPLSKVRKLGSIGKGLVKNTVGRLGTAIGSRIEGLGQLAEQRMLKKGYLAKETAQERLRLYDKYNIKDKFYDADRQIANFDSNSLKNYSNSIDLLRQIQGENYEKGSVANTLANQRDQAIKYLKSDLLGLYQDNKDPEVGLLMTSLTDKLNKAKTDSEIIKIKKELMDNTSIPLKLREQISQVFNNNISSISNANKKIDEFEKYKDDNLFKSEQLAEIKKAFGMEKYKDKDFLKMLPKLQERLHSELDFQNKEKQRNLEKATAEADKAVVENPQEQLQAEGNKIQNEQLSTQRNMLLRLDAIVRLFKGEKDLDLSELDPHKTNVKAIQELQNRLNSGEKSTNALMDYIKATDEKTAKQLQEDLFKSRQIYGLEKNDKTSVVQNLSDETLLDILNPADKDKKVHRKTLDSIIRLNKFKNEHNAFITNGDVLFKYDSKTIQRIVSLTELGYTIPDKDYKEISELSNTAFAGIKRLARLGVKFNDFSKFSKVEDTLDGRILMRNMIRLASIRINPNESLKIADVLDSSSIMDKVDPGYAGNEGYALDSVAFNPNTESQGPRGKASRFKNMMQDKLTDSKYDVERHGWQEGFNSLSEEEKESILKPNIDSNKNSIGSNARLSEYYLKENKNMRRNQAIVRNTDTVVEGIADVGESIGEGIFKFGKLSAKVSAKMADKAVKYALKPLPDEIYESTVQAMKDGYKDAVNEINQQKLENSDEEYKSNMEKIREEQKARSKEIWQNDIPKNDDEIDQESKTIMDKIKAEVSSIPTHAFGISNFFGNVGSGLGKLATGAIDPTKKISDMFGNSDSKSSSEDETSNNDKEKDSKSSTTENSQYSFARPQDIDAPPINPYDQMQGMLAQVNDTKAEEQMEKSKSRSTFVTTADGDQVEYVVSSADGKPMKAKTKDNSEIDKKNKYKLSLQERSTLALEKMANYISDKTRGLGTSIGEKVKDAGGGLFDMIKGLFGSIFNLPFDLLNMFGFGLGDKLKNLIGSGASLIGGKLLDKFKNSKLGTKLGDKLKNTLDKDGIGAAILRRTGLDSLATNNTNESNKETTNKSEEILENITDELQDNLTDSTEETKKDDNKKLTNNEEINSREKEIDKLKNQLKNTSNPEEQQKIKDKIKGLENQIDFIRKNTTVEDVNVKSNTKNDNNKTNKKSGFLSNSLDYAKKNKGRIGLAATALAAGIYGLSSSNDDYESKKDEYDQKVQEIRENGTEEDSPILDFAKSIGGTILGQYLGGKVGGSLGATIGGTIGGNITNLDEVTPSSLALDLAQNYLIDRVSGIGEDNDSSNSKNNTSFKDKIDNLKTSTKNMYDSISSRGKDVVDKAKISGSNIIDKVKTSGSNIVDKFKSDYGRISKPGMNSVEKSKIQETVSDMTDPNNKNKEVVQSVIGKLKSGLNEVLEKVRKWFPKNAYKAAKNFIGVLLERITQPNNIRRMLVKLARSTAGAVLGVGMIVVQGIGIITDFIHGFNSVEEMLKIPEGSASFGMKVVSGYVTAICGAIPFLGAIIPEDLVLELAIEYIGPVFGFGKPELEALRRNGDKQQKDDEKEVTDAQSMGDDWSSKIKKMTSGVVSSVVSTAHSVAASVADKASDLAKTAMNTASTASDWISDRAKAVKDWVYDKASKGADYLKEKASNAWQTAKEIAKTYGGKILDKAKELGSSAWEGAKDLGSRAYNSVFGSGKNGYESNYHITNKPIYGMGDSQFYSQLDPKYQMSYNSNKDSIPQSMSDSGCGPAALSNALSANGIQMDPRITAQYALNKGYKETNGGTRPEFFDDVLSQTGLGSERLHGSKEIQERLKQGKPVILMGKDSQGINKLNPYGKNPHYVTATGIDRKGKIIIQDPESTTPNQRFNMSSVLNKSSIAISTKSGRGKGIAIDYGKKYRKPNPLAPKYGMGVDMGAMIYEYLHKKIGLSSIVTAGIMGNMMAESSLNPRIVQGGGEADEITVDGSTGYGLCQWTDASRQQGLVDFANSQGKSTSDYQVQCDYMMHEIESGYSSLIANMDASGSAGQAALIFHEEFERSADTSEMAQRRADFAEQILQSEGKGIVEGGTYKGGSSNSGTQQKKNGGFFGALDNIASILSEAINPFSKPATASAKPKSDPKSGNYIKSSASDLEQKRIEENKAKEAVETGDASKAIDTTLDDGSKANAEVEASQNAEIFGDPKSVLSGMGKKLLISKFGKGDEETTEEQMTNNTTSSTTEETKTTDSSAKPTTSNNKSNGGILNGGLFNSLSDIASKAVSPLSGAMSQIGSTLMNTVNSKFGNTLKLFFGDSNPFADLFGGNDNSSSNSSTGQTQNMGIKVAGNPVDTLLGGMPGAIVTSDFNATEGRPTAGAHGGVDIGADEGTPIPSPISGEVVDLGSGYGSGYGNYIQIKDSQGNFHMFAHCQDQHVSKGQQVKPGDVIGTVGNTGNSYGAHLHYEIDPPDNFGAVKSGPHLNPNTYSGMGKYSIFGKGKEQDDDNIFEDINQPLNFNLPKKYKDKFIISDNHDFGISDDEQELQNQLYGTGIFDDIGKYFKRVKTSIKDWKDKYLYDKETKKDIYEETPAQKLEKQNSEIIANNKEVQSQQQAIEDNAMASNDNTKTENNNLSNQNSEELNVLVQNQINTNKLLQTQNMLLEQNNKLLQTLIQVISSNATNMNNMNKEYLNTNTKQKETPLSTNMKARLAMLGNGGPNGSGDAFAQGTNNFNTIISSMNFVATR